MSQTRRMVTALKKCPRAKGATYRNLAEALSLSGPPIRMLIGRADQKYQDNLE